MQSGSFLFWCAKENIIVLGEDIIYLCTIYLKFLPSMHTTLEKLDEHIHTQNPFRHLHQWVREVKVFIMLFIAVYATNAVITNFDLFVMAFDDNTMTEQVLTEKFAQSLENSWTEQSSKSIAHYSTPTTNNDDTSTDSLIAMQKQQRKINDIKRMFQQHTPAATSDFDAKEKVSSLLRQKLNDYRIDFNRLPPVNRLIIPSIGVDVPLIHPDYKKPIEEVTNEDFEADLFKWVVTYPTTPVPSDAAISHTMIFGHSSYQSWEKNPYATVFAKLTKLQHNDTIEIVWGGQLHQYRIVEKKIIYPSKIAEMYTQYNNGNYISLIACYPLWSTAKRSVVIAERIQ